MKIKPDKLRSIGNQSLESVESVLKKKEATAGRITRVKVLRDLCKCKQISQKSNGSIRKWSSYTECVITSMHGVKNGRRKCP